MPDIIEHKKGNTICPTYEEALKLDKNEFFKKYEDALEYGLFEVCKLIKENRLIIIGYDDNGLL